MLHKDYFVFMQGSIYYISQSEDDLPPNKLAARVRLTPANIDMLTGMKWTEYQSMLEHYYDLGQKLVTA